MDTTKSPLNIATIVPNNYSVSWEYVRCIFNLSGHYRFITKQGASVSDNRNRCFNDAKEDGGDLLFIDSDIIFSPQDVDTIQKDLDQYDIITGVYLLTDGKPAIFKKTETDYTRMDMGDGIFSIDACGAGFLAISERVIQKMKEPFTPVMEGDILHGEDISFCHRAVREGFDIHCDSNISLGHLKHIIISKEHPTGEYIY